MAIDYENKIKYIDDEENYRYLENYDNLPDKCPVCNHALSPTYILIYEKFVNQFEILCGCPRNNCGSLFFAVYLGSAFNSGHVSLTHTYPVSKQDKVFNSDIEDLSPEFVAIYNQSLHAEQEKLDRICGVGYRKSLEHLLKDYIISEHPEQEETVKAIHSIQKCINEYIDDTDIKEMAERATWLGNDETHYVRKWDGKDIQDLKNLIDITVFFISMKVKAKRYKEEMAR
ncbi:hypothetical protein QA612_19555 [Evansella sp. AB-P1]|uniref:hypothetical protein n=1 Tax=Evansella sp. AB-P1 TaxID=3037653 RepID=UPI00241D4CA9|nr:hypothetical protein [Evansella sp. AB-P1]MDG5789657.1 hypothetical protein [Evansella sp. AB-P1]